jgi:multicomponent Na+:H+ antiporter subunit F
VSAFFTGAALVVAVLILVGLIRVAKGPTPFDRMVAVALVTVNGLVLLLLIGAIFDRLELFVDIAIAIALLAFVLPVGLGKYYEREQQ